MGDCWTLFHQQIAIIIILLSGTDTTINNWENQFGECFKNRIFIENHNIDDGNQFISK